MAQQLNRILRFWLVILTAILTILLHLTVFASSDDVLSDPVVLGAWLYEGKCFSCHGDYESERIGAEFDDERELKNGIENDRCRIAWGRRHGGELNSSEINALVRFMMVWEELDEKPELPELPPQPMTEIQVRKPEKSPEETLELVPQEDGQIRNIKRILKNNPLAHGGWLYTKHCYRCHLTYESARPGRGMDVDNLERLIINGKVSTQMTPFSRMKGGELTGQEIRDIVYYITTWERFGERLALPSLVMKAPEDDPSALKPIPLPSFPAVKGDIKEGSILFVQHCSGCHGKMGEGYIGRSLVKKWWVLRFDLTIKSIIKDGVPGSLMPAWSQNSGGELGAKEIDDLVSLLVSWANGNN